MGDSPPHQTIAGKNILFLDGECAFCQRSAQILHKFDRQGRLYFSTLQGETAQYLPKKWRTLADLSGNATGTAILAEAMGSQSTRYWRGSDAILRSLRLVGGIVSLAWVFHFIPRPLRDGIYRWIAQRRHQLSGKTCPIPSKTFRDKLLP